MDNTTAQVVPQEGGTSQKAENGTAPNEEQQQQQVSYFQQQQQPPNMAAPFGGYPFALTGASPLQQQLSALAGLTSTTAATQPVAAPQAPTFMPNNSNNQLLQGLNPQLLQQLGIAVQAPAQANAQPQQQEGQTGSSDSQQQVIHGATKHILGNPQQAQHQEQAQPQQQAQQQQQQQQQLPQLAPQQPQQVGLNNIQQLQLMLMTNPQMFQGPAGANLLALMTQMQAPPQQQQPQLFQFPGLAQPVAIAAPTPIVNLNALLQAAAPNLGSLLQQQQNASNVNAFNKPTEPVVVVARPKAATEGEWATEPYASKGKKEPPFPLKLHQILSNPEFAECICWNSHGRSWRILKPPVFEQVVIPLYFRHTKYASFMRQVNGWGFKRIVSGNDHNSYYHELFQRDNPGICLKMKRIKKGESTKAKKEQQLGFTGDDESKDEEASKDEQEDDQINITHPAASATVQVPFQQFQQQNPSALQAALQSLQGGSAPGLAGAPMDAQTTLAGLIGSAGAAAATPQQPQIDPGVGALNLAAPGLSALAGLGQAAAVPGSNPTLAAALARGQKLQQQQQQSEQQQAPSASSPGPPAPAAPPAPTLGRFASSIDTTMLAKLLQQQTQQQNAITSGAPNQFLVSQLVGGGGVQQANSGSAGLAAQLQAALQPPAPAPVPAKETNDGGDDDDDREKEDKNGNDEKKSDRDDDDDDYDDSGADGSEEKNE